MTTGPPRYKNFMWWRDPDDLPSTPAQVVKVCAADSPKVPSRQKRQLAILFWCYHCRLKQRGMIPARDTRHPWTRDPKGGCHLQRRVWETNEQPAAREGWVVRQPAETVIIDRWAMHKRETCMKATSVVASHAMPGRGCQRPRNGRRQLEQAASLQYISPSWQMDVPLLCPRFAGDVHQWSRRGHSWTGNDVTPSHQSALSVRRYCTLPTGPCSSAVAKQPEISTGAREDVLARMWRWNQTVVWRRRAMPLRGFSA